MKPTRTIALVLTGIMMLHNSTVSKAGQVQEASSTSNASIYLDANEVRTKIIGNTIEGKVFLQGPGIITGRFYKHPNGSAIDRILVRNSYRRASGVWRVLDDGTVCTTYKARRQGRESCHRVILNGNQLILEPANDVAVRLTGKLLPGNQIPE